MAAALTLAIPRTYKIAPVIGTEFHKRKECRWGGHGRCAEWTCRFTPSVAHAPSFAGTATSAIGSRYETFHNGIIVT